MSYIDVIEYQGNNKNVIWKFPHTDFNTESQLIVHESQTAILFVNGQAMDEFGPGRHTLNVVNMPLLSSFYEKLTKEQVTPFKAEVYFINQVEQMAVKWGVGNINYIDPQFNGYAFSIGVNGDLSLKVENGRKLLINLNGQDQFLDQQRFVSYFKDRIHTIVRSVFPSTLRDMGISIYEIEEKLLDLSSVLKAKINQELVSYGMNVPSFFIESVLKPERDEQYIELNRRKAEDVLIQKRGIQELEVNRFEQLKRIQEAQTDKERQQLEAEALRYRQEQLGYTYQQDRAFDVMGKMAENEGAGSDLRNAAMGLGVGFGVGGAFGEAFGQMAQESVGQTSNIQTPVAQNQTESAKSNDTGLSSFENSVKKLLILKENGLINDEEFEKQKQDLLKKVMGE